MSILWGLFIISLFVLIFAPVIWVVGRLRLGLDVRDFGSALVAAIVIAFSAGVLTLLLSIVGIQDEAGLIGGIVHLIVSAIILMFYARFLPGLRVDGFGGALAASVAIGAMYWLGGFLLGWMLS